jgi:hypothetical protein
MKSLVLVISLLFLVGCGGSGSSLPSIDNSKLTTYSNEYGYYGENVQFGEYDIVDTWRVYNSDITYFFTFSSDGKTTLRESDTYGAAYETLGNYGVSKDGTTVSFDASYYGTMSIKIKSTSNDTSSVTKTDGTTITYHCYNISLTNNGESANLTMCPTPPYF